jgi:predicted helicase
MKKQINLFSDESYLKFRNHSISDYFTKLIEFKYGRFVEKDDIFYYIYAILHSEEYRSSFNDDLKLFMPRIPLVDSIDSFMIFSSAGRSLADLHLNYDKIQPLDEIKIVGNLEDTYVNKMTFLDKHSKDVIIFNKGIRIENIPSNAYQYILKGKSAIEHVMEEYQIKKDKDSGIINDPNELCIVNGDKKYILKLLLSVITISVKTVKIVKDLPKLLLKENEE